MTFEPRIAFIVDALPTIGGAEKTLFAALECFPNADVFTLIYHPEAFLNTPVAKARVFTSYLDRFPPVRSHHRLFLPLMPRAIESFDLGDYDTVVSFNYAVANGARAQGARHLSYTHTPMRYAWRDLNVGGTQSGNHPLIDRYLRSFRRWDRSAASRILAFAAISHDVAEKIRSAYQRESRVIYPPVEVDRFRAHEKRDGYYAVVTRLVAHKRVELIVEAFSALGLPLKIIGDGPERPKLMSRAADNIEFLGYRSDADVADLLSRARGFVCAADEDFGIAAVEAQAAGSPVIAYGSGGALETVVEGRTGVFFPRQSADCVTEAVRLLEGNVSSFNSQVIAQNARRFSKANFQREFRKYVEES